MEQKEFIEELSLFFLFFFFCGEISSLPLTLGAAESSLLLPTDGATQSSLPVAQGIRKYFITFYGHDLRLYYYKKFFWLIFFCFFFFFFFPWNGLDWLYFWYHKNNYVWFIAHTISNKYLCKNWEIMWFESLAFYYLLLVCANYYFGKVSQKLKETLLA